MPELPQFFYDLRDALSIRRAAEDVREAEERAPVLS